MARRLAAIVLSAELLLEFVKPHALHKIGVASDVPADAVLRGATYDAIRDVWLLGFESDALPEVPAGGEVPQLAPPQFFEETAPTDYVAGDLPT